MALNVFELFGKIAIDGNGAMSGIDATVGHAKKAESSLTKTFKKIGTVVAAAFSVRAVVDFGKQCTQAYASIAAEESAFAQIMGDYADTAREKLNAVADSTGVTSTRMTGAMTSLTAKFKGLGYDVEDATTLATDGLLIASDAAAFWDMSLEESMSHLNSFINGSYEGGEAIGLFANDTQMAAYAIEQGIVADTKAWAALDEAQRQATRLLYAKNMMEASGATGQAAKESQAYANVMANLKESWRQFQGVIGKPILEKIVLPAMQRLLKFMPSLTEATQAGIEILGEGFDKIASYFTDVFTEDGINMDALPDALSTMFRDLGRAIPGLLASVGRAIKGTWNNAVWPAIQGLFKATFGIELPAWSDIESKVKNWWDGGNGIAQAIADACNWTLNLFGAPANVTAEDVKSTLSSWWTNTKAFVQDVCDWTLKLFSNPKEAAEDVAAAIAPWWAKVVKALEDACKWTLNLFNAPDATADEAGATVGSWWTDNGIGKAVEEACKWMLPMFAPPETTNEDITGTMSGWWANVVGLVSAACVWTLNLFQPPPDVSKEDVVSTLDSWWAEVSEYVQEACSWTLNVFGAPKAMTAEEVETRILDWWKDIVTPLENACKWTLQMFSTPSADGQTISDTMAAWWATAKEAVEGVCIWTLKMFAKPKAKADEIKTEIKEWWDGILAEIGEDFCQLAASFIPPSVSDGVKKINAWWENVKAQISLSFTAFFGGVNGNDKKKPAGSASFNYGSGGGTGGGMAGGVSYSTLDLFDRYILPGIRGFATGLDYVPRDNFLARLHEGEAVLTSTEADAWRNGGTGRVEAALAQMAEILQDIARNTGAERQVVLETGALVGQLAPGIDAQLGAISNRKGRRN